MHFFLDANEDFLFDRKVDSVFQDLEAVARSCSVKKVFLKVSQNSQGNNCVELLF